MSVSDLKLIFSSPPCHRLPVWPLASRWTMENRRLLFLKVLWFVVLCESEVTSGCSVSVFAPQVITYSGGRVYDDLNEEQKGRVSFTSNFLAGDASLQIISLQSSDAGKYICKVKNAGQYEWARITLKVVGKVILLFFQTTTTKISRRISWRQICFSRV